MTGVFANIVSFCWIFRMAFTTEYKALLKNLFLLKGYRAHMLLAEFSTKNWTLREIDYLLKKLRPTRTTDRKKGSGRPKSTRTEENVSAVEELIISQGNILNRRTRRTFWAYTMTVDCTCITSFVTCVLFLVQSRISEHSVAIDLLKLNIFNLAHFQALLQCKISN